MSTQEWHLIKGVRRMAKTLAVMTMATNQIAEWIFIVSFLLNTTFLEPQLLLQV